MPLTIILLFKIYFIFLKINRGVLGYTIELQDMLVERHYTRGSPEIIELCSLSKELYNRCNYLMRQIWFTNLKNYAKDQNCKWIKLPDINDLNDNTRELDCYKKFNHTKIAKQVIRKVLTDWSTFRKSLTAYKRNPSSFIKKPKSPNYKKKLSQVIFYNETIRKKPLKLDKIEPTNGFFSINSKIKDFKQVIITPKTFGFIIDVQYEQADLKPEEKVKFHKDSFCSIDVGVNNLCSITSDQHLPLLINGRILKSINQWFNKNKSKKSSRKRYFRIENYFHHVSKMIIENCKSFGIKTIIIGKNDYWKQDTKGKMRKKNSQNFQSIPFCKLFEKIIYKAKRYGIEVVFTEEAYTSKSSFLDRDLLPSYDDPNASTIKFSGTRIKRGLYRSKDGRILNSDVNGSANICRKVIQDTNVLSQLDRSLAARPKLVNPLKDTTQQVINSIRLTA